MKIIICFLLFFISYFSFKNAQGQQMRNHIFNRNCELVTEFTKSHYYEKKDLFFYTKKTNSQKAKSLQWMWDTIITYDTVGVMQMQIQIIDASGNIHIKLTEQWQSTAWENYKKITYTYDANGKYINILGEVWQANAWANSFRNTYTCDANGKYINILGEGWQTNAWVNSWKYTYIYDANGNMLTQLEEDWQTNAWVNFLKDTFTFDANGNVLTFLYEEWQTNLWVNIVKDTYTYDANGNMLTQLEEDWQTNAWVNFSKDTYTYDANGNMLSGLYKEWQTNVWVNNMKDTYTYDADGNMNVDLWEYWQNNSWVNSHRKTYTYDANGNSITGKTEQWQAENWQPNINYLYLYSSKNYFISNIYRYEASYKSIGSEIGYNVSGVIKYNSTSNISLNSVVVNLLNGTTQIATTSSDASGQYIFTNIFNGTYTVELKTTKPWGGVTATDALKLKRHIAGLELLIEPIRFTAADANNSNTLTATDVLKMQRRIVGLDNTFAKGDWVFEKPISGGKTITVNVANVIQDFYGLCTGDVNGSLIPSSISLPIVNTLEISYITQTTATGGGNVVSDGGASITDRGICWSTIQNPTITDSHTSDGIGIGVFTSNMTGLTTGINYYVRAYATNSAGTNYGNQFFLAGIAYLTFWKNLPVDISVYTSTSSTNVYQQSNFKGTVTANYVNIPNCNASGCVTTSTTTLPPNNTIYYYCISTDNTWIWNGSLTISSSCHTLQLVTNKNNENMVEEKELIFNNQSIANRKNE